MEKQMLNVFFVVDKNFITHFTVSLTSLLENNRDIDISVYVIHDLDDKFAFDNIISFCKSKYNVILNIIEIDNSIFDNLPITDNISKASYFRLLLADILPQNVLSGLYIDCDTIVTGSLKDLLEISFFDQGDKNKEYSLLAVSDANGAKEVLRLNELGVDSKFYFNAGVLFINLEKWRSDAVSKKIMIVAEQYKDHLKWHDQDVLNIFFVNKSGKLDAGYNGFASKLLPKMPVILHFNGSSKPWHYFNEGPYKSIYWKYLKMTPFKNERFEEITINNRIRKIKNIVKKHLNIQS
jgi:lipopolysaccharide biosynthesis glycosyltransferase